MRVKLVIRRSLAHPANATASRGPRTWLAAAARYVGHTDSRVAAVGVSGRMAAKKMAGTLVLM